MSPDTAPVDAGQQVAWDRLWDILLAPPPPPEPSPPDTQSVPESADAGTGEGR
jgi:hypothetical protein